MATQVVYLSGIAKWCKNREPDPKYGNYEVDLYLDEESWLLFEGTGSRATPKEDDEGEKFIRLRRPHQREFKDELKIYGPPASFLNGEPFTGNIGNGSKVTVKVEVYDTKKGKGTRWEAIRVDELVEYEGKEVVASEGVVPF